MPPRRAGAGTTINLASVVYGLEAYLQDRGVDPQEALDRADLQAGDLADPERRVPLLRYLELLELCSDLLDDPLFGLKFGARYHPRHAGVAGNVALAAPTVGEGLRTFSRYLCAIVDSAVYDVEVSNGVVTACTYYTDPLMMSYQQKADWSIAFMCNLIRCGTGDPDWAPLQALLPNLPDESRQQRRSRTKILGAPVEEGYPWAGIRFPESVLDRPMVTADAMVERLMRHYGDLQLSALPRKLDEMESLRREIGRLLLRGECTLSALARSVGTSTRTLQRRLAAADVSFSTLLDDVRRSLALNMLEHRSLPLGEIAFSLGYSEVSAFNHAFRRWFGRSPGEHRAKLAVSVANCRDCPPRTS